MTKLKITALLTLIVLGIVLLLNSCKKDDEGTATLNVSLKDAPGDYQQVNVEVIGVEVNTPGGWRGIVVNDSIYDLLLLTDSSGTFLGSGSVPADKITQVRLLLGDDNSVMIDSIVHPLALSSQDETGLKINVNQDLSNGSVYTLMLDFEAEESVVSTGNGQYKLKPVLTGRFL